MHACIYKLLVISKDVEKCLNKLLNNYDPNVFGMRDLEFYYLNNNHNMDLELTQHDQ